MDRDLIHDLAVTFNTDQEELFAALERGEKVEIKRNSIAYEDHYSDMARSDYWVLKAVMEDGVLMLQVVDIAVFNYWRSEEIERIRSFKKSMKIDVDNHHDAIKELLALVRQ